MKSDIRTRIYVLRKQKKEAFFYLCWGGGFTLNTSKKSTQKGL